MTAVRTEGTSVPTSARTAGLFRRRGRLRVPAESTGRGRTRRRIAAGAAGVAMMAAGLTLLPVTAPPSQAVSTSTLGMFDQSVGNVVRILGKLVQTEKNGKWVKWETNPWFVAPASLLVLGAPLFNQVVKDKDPNADALDKVTNLVTKVKAMQTELSQMQQSLDAVTVTLTTAHANSMLGACHAQTAQLNDYLTALQTGNDMYAEIVDQLQHLRTPADVAVLKEYTDQFVKDQLGTAVLVDGAPMAKAVDRVHIALMNSAGAQGMIQICGKAYLADWKARNLAAAPKMSAGSPGLWMDDRAYYKPLQDLVEFWETAQAQGVYLLQQAVLIKAGLLGAGKIPAPTDGPAQVCDKQHADAVTDVGLLCSSAAEYTKRFYGNLVTELRTVGAPYSDDKVVLQTGTKITGLRGAGDVDIPTTIWARDPAATKLSWATSPQLPGLSTKGGSYDGLDDWVPADDEQWLGLTAGYRQSHPSDTTNPAPLQRDENGDAAPGARVGGKQGSAADVATFGPVDVLRKMTGLTSPVPDRNGVAGVKAFGAGTSGAYWIPGTSVPVKLENANGGGSGATSPSTGLGFPNSSHVSDAKSSVAASFADNGFEVRCMVLAADGVLCDDTTISSWWMSRQHSSYVSTYAPHLGGLVNWDVDATWTVTPTTPGAGVLSASGTRTGCKWSGACTVYVQQVKNLPGWLNDYTNRLGTTWKATPMKASVWPTTRLPAFCETQMTTTWGVPTRCGDALTQYLADTLPSLSEADL
jgi:hypothetical protein